MVMMLSLAACGGNSTDETTPATEPGNETVEYVYEFADLVDDYDELSSAIYEKVLGEFMSTYEAAYEAEYSRLPSKRCPSIGFLSRADREIGVFRQVANFPMRPASS